MAWNAPPRRSYCRPSSNAEPGAPAIAGLRAIKNGGGLIQAHAAKDSHQRGSWLVCRREILLKLQFHPAKIDHGEKRTLCNQWLNFFRLTDAKLTEIARPAGPGPGPLRPRLLPRPAVGAGAARSGRRSPPPPR